MKSWFLVFVYLLMAAEVSAQSRRTPRPLDPLAADTLEQAVAGSPLVRDLIRRLEGSNLIVHIESSRQLPMGVSGTMRFVTSRGGYRYVRISLATDLRPEARAAILGHELQHACELAASDAHDLDAVRRLYQASGHRLLSGQDFFETRAARIVERQVRSELRAEPLHGAASSRPEVPSRPGVPSRQDR
ncbi:MAG: hypothetical protein WC815_04395 [Vicinamibacterales bacterium]